MEFYYQILLINHVVTLHAGSVSYHCLMINVAFIRGCFLVIPGSSPYSPPEDGYEDEPYDPEFGINSPDAMAVTAKTEVSILFNAIRDFANPLYLISTIMQGRCMMTYGPM